MILPRMAADHLLIDVRKDPLLCPISRCLSIHQSHTDTCSCRGKNVPGLRSQWLEHACANQQRRLSNKDVIRLDQSLEAATNPS